MDLVELDLCVVLPVSLLDPWVRADPATRAGWLAGTGPVSEVRIAGDTAFVFRREPPRPSKAVIVSEARRKVAVVLSGGEAAARAAVDDPASREVIAPALRVPSSLMVIGGELAHADVGGGTPVAGPHRMVDLAPGAYRVELRTVGRPGEPSFARVLAYEPAG